MNAEHRFEVYPRQLAKSRFCRRGVGAALAAGLIGSSLISASNAEAGDEKVYASAFCQPSNPSTSDNLIYQAGRLISVGAASQVVCPIVRDNTRNTNGLTEVWVTGFRTEQNVGSNFGCSLFSTNHRGETIDIQTITFPATLGRVAIVFELLNVSRNETGHYAIQCTMPNGSSLIEYEVEEPD
jgi:hypothetical protein